VTERDRGHLKPITIKHIRQHIVTLELVEPLATSFGAEAEKTAVLIELVTERGITGWGEVSVSIAPGYGSETIGTAEHILKYFIFPLLKGKTIEQATDVPGLLKPVRGNHHAKAGVEAAVWDALAKTNDRRLVDLFSAHLPDHPQPRDAALVGVSIGIQPSVEATTAIIRKRLDQGYARIKLKIKQGWDLELVRGVRRELPDISLMLDANSDYTLDCADHLARLDAFNLLMIEQPLAYDDIYEHSLLQQRLKTPICLDESIRSAHDLQLALRLDALRILNLKPARVGGFSECLKIATICTERKVPLWVGGMLETGLGRAANVALAALPAVTLPSDISATDRYFALDITEPAFVLSQGSTIAVPDGYGIGVEVQRDRLEAAAARWRERNPYGLKSLGDN
jgi:O-succinylbenzoate synthase